MVTEDTERGRGRAPRVRGHLEAAALATALGFAGHAAGGGRLTVACAPLVLVLLIALATTWAADRMGARRGVWGALPALVAGQCALEGAVSLPGGSAPSHLVVTSIVHALAAIAGGVVLLGTDRVVEDLLAALDQVLPRLRRVLLGPAGPPAARPPMPRVPLLTLRSEQGAHDRTLRGPPVTA